MIQANELRLGNYVNVPREDQSPFRIDLIEYACKDFIKVGMNVHKYEFCGELIDGHPLTWELNDLEPIKLSIEWLEKLGFESYPHFTVMNSKFFKLGRDRQISISCVGTPNEMIYLQEVDEENAKINDLICLRNFDYDGITHVHTLQNIIHSISGIELTIKS